MRIEDKKHLFDLPELDEREFEYMLSKAKTKAEEQEICSISLSNSALFNNKRSVYRFFQGIIISPRVAAILAFTILVVGVFCYSSASPLSKAKAATVKNSTPLKSIDKNTRVPIENDNVVSVATYTEKFF